MSKKRQILEYHRPDGSFTVSEFDNKEQVNGAIERALAQTKNGVFTKLVWHNHVDGSTENITLPNYKKVGVSEQNKLHFTKQQ